MALEDFRRDHELPSGQYKQDFCEFVVEWEWPVELKRAQTDQIKNVTTVLWRIYQNGPPYQDVPTYQEAKEWRASEARVEDPTREDKYENAVHANCVRDRGFRGNQAMHDFVREARRLIEAYEEERMAGNSW